MRPFLGSRPLVAAVVLALFVGGCSLSDGAEDSLTVFGSWRGEEAAAFISMLDEFQAATGITVRYTGTSAFTGAIVERVEEGDPPDVAVFPQPGLLEDMVTDGYVLPLREDVQDLARTAYLPAIAAIGADDGINGVVFRVSVKSLVWYRPDVFAERGYQVPTSWSELETLTAEVLADGTAPWCLGISAFGATGWPATDWVEDIVLRTAEPEVYDGWVDGSVPFTDDAIGEAVDQFGSLVLAGDRAYGGRRNVINTSPAEAQDPMFEDPAECLLYRQASFQVDNLPDGSEVGPDGDVDVFVLPGLDPSVEAPLLIGGDFAAALTDRPETWQLLRFLATREAGEPWATSGNFISPFSNFDAGLYGSDFDARMADLLQGAATVRFDGSDLMYPPVGTRSFFDAMLLYIANSKLDEAMEIAQAGYDQ